jgi:hypothetical protein
MLAFSSKKIDSEATALRRTRRSACGALAGALIAACALGCGGGSGGGAHLQGKVTLDGKDVPADANAHIMFVPEAGKSAATVTAPIADSRYDARNVPLGPVTVHFDITQAVGPMKRSERTGAEYRDVVNLVPAQHATGIPIEVTGDKADQDFQL